MEDFNAAINALSDIVGPSVTVRLKAEVAVALKEDNRKDWMRVGYALARLHSRLEEALDQVKATVGEL